MVINQGATLKTHGMALGAIFIASGLYLFNTSNLTLLKSVGVFSAILGLLIFPWIIQFEIEKTKLILTKRLVIWPLKFKLKTIDLKEAENVMLKLFSQNQRMNNLSQSTSVRTRSYDISINVAGQSIIVSESTDYNLSFKRLDEIGDLLSVQKINKFEEMKDSLQNNRRR